ncbi:MAG: HAD-IA family hydrolase [Hyphomicrobiales bacterium]|nr:HAD-IA family hydrolase [Hyphomicrobiales bacterium]
MHLVLFDVDGTLVDSQHMIVAAMNRAFEAVGRVPPPRAATLSVVGLSLAEAMTRLLDEDAEPAAVARLAEAYKSAYFDLRSAGGDQEQLYPGARAVLDALSARDDVLMGLATGKSHRGIRAILDLHDLHGRFVTLQCADDHPSKPHPAMVLAGLAETGVAPERAVIVGDTVFDVEMGRSAGILAIGVAWGYHPADRLAQAGAATVLGDFAELTPTLARLFRW